MAQRKLVSGVIEGVHANHMYSVLVDATVVLCHADADTRKRAIRFKPGDEVRVEVSLSDSSRGRIVTSRSRPTPRIGGRP